MLIKWIKNVFKTKSLKVGLEPDLSKIKRKVTKYFQNNYNGTTGYLSCPAVNFNDVTLFSMDVKDINNKPIERVMEITKKDYYNDFGYECVMLNYKRTNFLINC